jgi:hypothetical protein
MPCVHKNIRVRFHLPKTYECLLFRKNYLIFSEQKNLNVVRAKLKWGNNKIPGGNI